MVGIHLFCAENSQWKTMATLRSSREKHTPTFSRTQNNASFIFTRRRCYVGQPCQWVMVEPQLCVLSAYYWVVEASTKAGDATVRSWVARGAVQQRSSQFCSKLYGAAVYVGLEESCGRLGFTKLVSLLLFSVSCQYYVSHLSNRKMKRGKIG